MVNWKKPAAEAEEEDASQTQDPVQAAIAEEHRRHAELVSHVTGIHATPAEMAADREPAIVLPKGEYTPAKKGNGPVQ